MRVRPLLLDESIRAAIRRVMTFAERRRFSVHDLLKLQRRDIPAPGCDDNYVVHIPIGYRCVFTIEQQPFGWSRHLSISVQPPEPKTYCSVEAAVLLLPEFGFWGDLTILPADDYPAMFGAAQIFPATEPEGDMVPNMNFIQPLAPGRRSGQRPARLKR